MNTMIDSIFLSPWNLNPAQIMTWGGYKTSRILLALGDFHNNSSDRNCGYWLNTSHSTCQYEHNGWSDVFLTLKIEYSTEHGMDGRQKNGFLLAWVGFHNVWSDRNCGYWLNAASRAHQDEHNGWSDAFLSWKLNTAQSMAWGGEKRVGFY